MIVADLMDCVSAPMNDADIAGTDGHNHDGDSVAPTKRLNRRYLNPEGSRIQVITEWWPDGSAPQGRDADPDPDMPGYVVTQFVRRSDEDGEDVIFNPMGRAR